MFVVQTRQRTRNIRLDERAWKVTSSHETYAAALAAHGRKLDELNKRLLRWPMQVRLAEYHINAVFSDSVIAGDKA